MADTLLADHPKLEGDLKFRGRCPASPPLSPPLSPESRAAKLLDGASSRSSGPPWPAPD